MKTNRLIIFLFLGFLSLSCNTKDLSLDKNLTAIPIKATKKSVSTIDFSVARTGDNYDIGSNIALLPNNKIWTTGGWKALVNALYSSSDTGKSWESKRIPVERLSTTANITFIDSENGWAVGWLRIVKTNDGGASWQKVELPAQSEMTDLQSVRFFDSQVGYVGGTTGYVRKETYESLRGIEILCTENGGALWSVCYKNTKHSSIYNIVASAKSDVFGLVDGILLLLSEDKGQKWNEIYLTTPVTSIAVNSDDSIWLIGENGLQVSRNKGRTWNSIEGFEQSKDNQSWNALAFNSRGIGIAVGGNGRIAVTKDNGKTWEIETNVTSENLLKIEIQDSIAVILGEKNLYSLKID